ncbi:MAG: hypothetical protein WCP29_15865 [Acidobacteriota bacterium]
MILAIVMALVIGEAQAPAQTVDATKVVVSAPATIVEIDAGKMKGDIIRLAWSTDKTQIYLQTAEQDGSGDVRLRHFLLELKGQQPKGTGEMPAWADAYWLWKSAQGAPGLASLKIAVEQQQKRLTATATPTGGDLARGGLDSGGGGRGSSSSGGGSSDAVGAAQQSQMVRTITLKLKGEVVGEFVNAPALPGTTLGWGPAGSGLIAFKTADGRLTIMDEQSRKMEISGTKDVSLPAWTMDGKRIAWLEKSGRNKFTLRVVDVTIPAS